MDSVLGARRKGKKRLGRVKVIRRERYEGMELDARLELIRSLIPLGLMQVQEELDRRSAPSAVNGMSVRAPA